MSKPEAKVIIFHKIHAFHLHIQKISLPLQSHFGKVHSKYAEIAQLVEHDLAKVGVASSSLVFRSKESRRECLWLFLVLCAKRLELATPEPSLREGWEGSESRRVSSPRERESRFPLQRESQRRSAALSCFMCQATRTRGPRALPEGGLGGVRKQARQLAPRARVSFSAPKRVAEKIRGSFVLRGITRYKQNAPAHEITSCVGATLLCMSSKISRSLLLYRRSPRQCRACKKCRPECRSGRHPRRICPKQTDSSSHTCHLTTQI